MDNQSPDCVRCEASFLVDTGRDEKQTCFCLLRMFVSILLLFFLVFDVVLFLGFRGGFFFVCFFGRAGPLHMRLLYLVYHVH